jgi:hypothetical protein
MMMDIGWFAIIDQLRSTTQTPHAATESTTTENSLDQQNLFIIIRKSAAVLVHLRFQILLFQGVIRVLSVHSKEFS